MAFLNKGLKIILHDLKGNKDETFHYEGGIKALKGIAAKDLIEELRFRGYKGKLTYSREVVV